MNALHDDHYYRLKKIVGPDGCLPISAATWWAGVKSGRYPAAIKLGPRITVWKGSAINALMKPKSDVDAAPGGPPADAS